MIPRSSPNRSKQGHKPEIVETDGEAGGDSEEGTSAGESEESSDDQEDTT